MTTTWQIIPDQHTANATYRKAFPFPVATTPIYNTGREIARALSAADSGRYALVTADGTVCETFANGVSE